MASFRHSGKLGDIVYSLPTVRALGGGYMYLNAQGGHVGSSDLECLRPLIAAQKYITGCSLWAGESFDYDLDKFRENEPERRNLADAHLDSFGLASVERDQPWLSAVPATPERPIILSRTSRLGRAGGFWTLVYKRLGEDAVFLGTQREYESFTRDVGPIPWYPTADLQAAASALASISLFAGSQSCLYSIAEGLKLPAVLDVDPYAHNCMFGREQVLPVITDEDLQGLDAFLARLSL